MKTAASRATTGKSAAGSTGQGPVMADNRPAAVKQRKMQAAIAGSARQQVQQQKANKTGLPDQLKNGVEDLSGHSLDDVQVHYNSEKPAQMQAHAYAQGTEIHVAPGQEQHLPHEAWHVVQQKQGRVKPTMQLKGKENINDNAGLEKEADAMGAKAAQLKRRPTAELTATRAATEPKSPMADSPVQLKLRDPNDAAREAVLIQEYKAAEASGDAIAKSVESTPREQTRAMQYYQTAAAKRERVNGMHDVTDAGHRQAIIDLGTKIAERQALITTIKNKEKTTAGKKRQKAAVADRDAAPARRFGVRPTEAVEEKAPAPATRSGKKAARSGKK